MVEKNKPMSMEELDFIELLVAQVAPLSSSTAVEVTCEVVIVESLILPPVVMDL
jgi:hypothetical protein